MRIGLYIYAVRVARMRQLRARALRPLARRRFPAGDPPCEAQPVRAAEALWRSAAFEPAPALDDSTRLGRFQRQYGEDVLEAARAGDIEEARQLIAAWIDAHPPHPDDAWHPYPLSTRVGNWIAALTLLPELASPNLSRSLWHQLARLERNIENDVLGNHLIRNARALVLGGSAFGAPELTGRGLDLLRRELVEQVLPDGGHYERSPAYHLLVLRDLLEVQASSPHVWLSETIDRMRGFAAALQRPDGLPALFNDGGVDVAPRLDLPEPRQGLHVLRESGFAIVREGKLWLAFRCGKPAPAFLPPHAHADALSLQLWWDGRPVLVDPGTYTYEPGPDRDRFRGTAAHSTLVVDGRDQFSLWGAFRSGPLPEVELRDAREAALEASVVLAGGIRHIRRIEWEPGRVVIRDRLEGNGRHRVESRLLVAPDLPSGVSLEPAAGDDAQREEAWVSERFGERTETTAAVVRRVDAELPLDLTWTVELPL